MRRDCRETLEGHSQAAYHDPVYQEMVITQYYNKHICLAISFTARVPVPGS